MYVKPPGQRPRVDAPPRKIVEVVCEHSAEHDDRPPPSAGSLLLVEVLAD
jgi:hypothetical protein